MIMLSGQRERHDEPGAAVRRVVDGDGTAVASDDVGHDGQAESCPAAALSGFVEAGELFEYLGPAFRRDAGSVVNDDEGRSSGVLGQLTVTVVVAWRWALSRRLPTTRRSSSRSPVTCAAETRRLSTITVEPVEAHISSSTMSSRSTGSTR